MSMTVKGKIEKVFETKQVSDKFSKREFVCEIAENPKYPELVMFEVTGDKCGMLDGYGYGDEVRVDFNLRGREWRSPSGEVRYFNTLRCWKIERLGEAKAANPTNITQPTDQDDIPFASCDMTHEPSAIAKVLRGR